MSGPPSRAAVVAMVALLSLGAAGCRAGSSAGAGRSSTTAPAAVVGSSSARTSAPTRAGRSGTAEPIADPPNVYAHAGAGMFRADERGDKAYVYVPSNDTGTVTVIDQRTRSVVGTYPVGKLAQHVVPAHGLDVLYATASGANQLVPIDPRTGLPGRPIPVAAPYNLYFTPDGRSAVVMAERLGRMDFYDPKTWQQQRSVPVPCRGVNHADWSVDGRWFVVTCEFSGQLLQVDSGTGRVLRTIALPSGSMPQDIRLTPDGKQFYVADMMYGGLWTLDAQTLTVGRLIATGKGTHGIYPSRDGTRFYISNRGRAMGDEHRRSHDGDGSVSVVDPGTGSVTATWTIPGGGSPDMGGVSGDGTLLWLSGRYDAEVYAFDTATGRLVARIPVPSGPHGLCVFPQPGRYSLGHTGNDR